MSGISVCIVDDHPILLTGLASLLSAASGFTVAGTGSTARDALDLVARHDPDVLILDLGMPGNTVAAIAEIAQAARRTRVMVFTASNSIDLAIDVLEAGANGYVLKGSTSDELIQAIHAVSAGDTFITPSFAAKVVAGLRTASLRKASREAIRLSFREEQVLRLLLRGSTNKEIADHLAISDKTVKHYMTLLMQKLNVRNRIEVVLAAQQLELARSAGSGVPRS